MHEDIGEIADRIREDRMELGKLLKQRDRDPRLNEFLIKALDLGYKIGYTTKAAEIKGSYGFADRINEIYKSIKEQLD